MNVSYAKISPLIYRSGEEQTVYVTLGKSERRPEGVSIRIQAMESYEIPHTDRFRIDEEDRYPFFEMEFDGERYFYKHYFSAEQKYKITLKSGDTVLRKCHVYAIDMDLVGMYPYKGDTHLHSCRSDGQGTPLEVAIAYRGSGYDFIALTDHHKYLPSLEARDAISRLTDAFTVFPGEEVHNKSMGYFHVVNFGGRASVNDIIESDDAYVESEINRILGERDFPAGVDKRGCAYRIFIAEHIRRFGGIAIMAHPFWDVYGEYHMQSEDVRYLWREGLFDALELMAADDRTGNGDNLQVALWGDLRAEGVKIPIVGASDAHTTVPGGQYDSLFNRHFSIVFAKDTEDISKGILDLRSVAVNRRTDSDFFAFGSFRYVKYARFLLEEYFPAYTALCARHAEALAAEDTAAIKEAERDITEYKKAFFGSAM